MAHSRSALFLAAALCAAGATGGAASNVANPPAHPFIDSHDTNGDGRVTRQELVDLFEKGYRHLDYNGDGFFTQHEKIRSHREQLRETFGESADLNGKISEADFVIGQVDELAAREADRLMDRFDHDGDGVIVANDMP